MQLVEAMRLHTPVVGAQHAPKTMSQVFASHTRPEPTVLPERQAVPPYIGVQLPVELLQQTRSTGHVDGSQTRPEPWLVPEAHDVPPYMSVHSPVLVLQHTRTTGQELASQAVPPVEVVPLGQDPAKITAHSPVVLLQQAPVG